MNYYGRILEHSEKWYFIFNDSFQSWLKLYTWNFRSHKHTHTHIHTYKQTLYKQIDQWGMKVLSCEYNRFYSLFWLKKIKKVKLFLDPAPSELLIKRWWATIKNTTWWRGRKRRHFLCIGMCVVICNRVAKVGQRVYWVGVCVCEYFYAVLWNRYRKFDGGYFHETQCEISTL